MLSGLFVEAVAGEESSQHRVTAGLFGSLAVCVSVCVAEMSDAATSGPSSLPYAGQALADMVSGRVVVGVCEYSVCVCTVCVTVMCVYSVCVCV